MLRIIFGVIILSLVAGTGYAIYTEYAPDTMDTESTQYKEDTENIPFSSEMSTSSKKDDVLKVATTTYKHVNEINPKDREKASTSSGASTTKPSELTTTTDQVIEGTHIKPETPKEIKYGLTEEECAEVINSSPFYLDPSMQALKKVKELVSQEKYGEAHLLRDIACNPQGIWLNGSNSVFTAQKIQEVVDDAEATSKIPVFVLYNGPNHNTLQWRHIQRGDPYFEWIRLVGETIGSSNAWIVLEPDALALTYGLSESDRSSRLLELRKAVLILKETAPNAQIYIDSGHNKWKPVEVTAEYLRLAGVEFARGFSLNVSNYQTTEDELEYGYELSDLLSGAHFVIDTSRNGNGPPDNLEWCNATGRSIGEAPVLGVPGSVADGFLWIKLPGESDGYCNGGESPGTFWLEYALDLVRNKK